MYVGNDAERRIPVIEPFDSDRTLPEGETLKLICKASGSPRPVLSWYRNGQVLEGSGATDDDPHDEPPPHSRYLPAGFARTTPFVPLSVLIENIATRRDCGLPAENLSCYCHVM